MKAIIFAIAIMALLGASQGTRVLRSAPPAPDGPMCTACEAYVQMAEDYIASNATLEAAGAIVKAEICPNIPVAAAKVECFEQADVIVGDIIKFVETKLSPHAVCTYANVCGPSTTLNAVGDECSTCKMIVLEVDTVLESNATATAILKYAMEGCTKVPLPAAQQTECQELVQTYGPAILKQLAAAVTPDLCTKVGVCPAAVITTKTTTDINVVSQ